MDSNDALLKALAPSEDELLVVEYDLPRVDGDAEELAEQERERYDEQILAALVAPSF